MTCECGDTAIARGMCRSCYDQWYYRENRETVLRNKYEQRDKIFRFIQRVKRRAECARCGEGHPATLQFHHRQAEDKNFNISEFPQHVYALESVKDEMRKCDILCANCHLKEHS